MLLLFDQSLPFYFLTWNEQSETKEVLSAFSLRHVGQVGREEVGGAAFHPWNFIRQLAFPTILSTSLPRELLQLPAQLTSGFSLHSTAFIEPAPLVYDLPFVFSVSLNTRILQRNLTAFYCASIIL
jgi:hypothetical protein